LKIGIDVRELEKGKATGIGQYLLNFLRFAIKNKQEWEFILFGNQDTQINLDAPNLKKIFIPEYLTFWWDQVQLPHHLKKEKIDLFLTPYFKAPLFDSCKLVVIINDLIPLLAGEYQNLRRFLKRVYFKSLANAAARRADKVITISHHSKKDILDVFQVPEEKIEVIYLSVDESYRPINSNLEKIISKYGISKRFILYFGNFNPHKNVKSLIESYNNLPEKIKSEYQLVLGGRRDRHCIGLEKMVKHLKIKEKVVFTAFISEEDLPSIYSAASLFVFPSLYEGFGLPPLEAMACGTPVIASNTTSLPEVIGEAGFLVDAKNVWELGRTILTVLQDDKLRDKLRQKGLNRVKEFSISKTSKKILNLLEQIVIPSNRS